MISDDHIGGAFVRRPFDRSGERLLAGHRLTGEEVRNIRLANRRALIDAGYLEVWPEPHHTDTGAPGERHVVSLGFGRFGVIEGRKLNEHPMTKDEAEKLAAARTKDH